MAYTDQTKDNYAVQLLVGGETVRVDSLGSASLGLYSGIIQFSVSVEARTDSAAAYVTVYDSGEVSNDCEVKIATSSATITDNGGARTAGSLAGYTVTGARRYTWLDTLTAPVGEWVIQVSTAANTGATPLVFSRFHAEEASVIGASAVTTANIADDAVTNDKIRNSAAVSVIGRSAATVGGPADIVATEGSVLRMATTLGFGQVATAGIEDEAVTTGKLDDEAVTTTKLGADSVGATALAPLEFNAQIGTSYVLAAADNQKIITLSNGGAITLDVPLNATVALPVGFTVTAFTGGAGAVAITPEGGVTINSLGGNLDISGQYGFATLIKTATDTWLAYGNLA
jgi:hypothetical protein